MHVLCLVCGLPGAGKSTALRAVREREQPQQHVVILFDEVQAFVMETLKVAFSPEIWHLAQEVFYTVVVRRMHRGDVIPAGDGTAGADDARGKDEGTGDPRITDLAGEYTQQLLAAMDPQPTDAATRYIFAEDNFSYKSMRRRYFRAALAAGWGYTVMWCDCPVDVCVARNAARADAVDPAIITTMAGQVRGEDMERDRYLRVYDTCGGTPGGLVAALLEQCAAAEDVALVDREGEEAARLEASRTATAASLSHALDGALRKAAGELLAALPPAVKAKAGRMVAQLKREALKAAKPRTPDDVDAAADAFRASAWKALAYQSA